ncbi:hypothetical protein ACFQL0_07355 [Haloplanus litoreus]|uniref:hypothetical protein n=1 Tax=Haloplanus litoreus TaxID=767515 RepID=UPI00360D8388
MVSLDTTDDEAASHRVYCSTVRTTITATGPDKCAISFVEFYCTEQDTRDAAESVPSNNDNPGRGRWRDESHSPRLSDLSRTALRRCPDSF